MELPFQSRFGPYVDTIGYKSYQNLCDFYVILDRHLLLSFVLAGCILSEYNQDRTSMATRVSQVVLVEKNYIQMRQFTKDTIGTLE